MTTTTEKRPLESGVATGLQVALRQEQNGPVLTTEPVHLADLVDIQCEAWRDGCLRQGCPAASLAEVSIQLVPQSSASGRNRCTGFSLEVTSPAGKTSSWPYTIYSLGQVAQRAAKRVMAAGTLKAGDNYYYEIQARGAGAIPLATQHFEAKPLTFLTMPLAPLLAEAGVEPEKTRGTFPVFYTGDSLDRAERCSRLGDREKPPVETGGVLVGSLASCPETGELFSLIFDVLEVQEAEEKAFSLSYSSRSWHRIQTIMAAKQKTQPDRAERILGQCHGHNFLPNNGLQCKECVTAAVCGSHSAGISEADVSWSRAVLSQQPWGLCHIFGLTARNEPVDQLYSPLDGTYQGRNYHVLNQFNIEQWFKENPS